MRINHGLYYFLELVALAAGFCVVFMFSYSLFLQGLVLTLVLIFYSAFGAYHHHMHHNLDTKIMLEYILISLVILSIFVFLNIGKI